MIYYQAAPTPSTEAKGFVGLSFAFDIPSPVYFGQEVEVILVNPEPLVKVCEG